MGRRVSRMVGVACLCITLLAGCSESEPSAPIEQKQKTLVIGLIPEQNIFKQIDRYEPVAEYLSEKIGMKLELIVLTRYGSLVNNFVSTGLDGAFFGSFTYALAHARLGVEALARPETLDGVSTYHGLILTRKDSGIKTVKDMKGKRFAFVDRGTTAGYLFPMMYFKEHGIKNYKTYFAEDYFTGTHEDVIYDVLNKKADVGAAKNTVFERLSKEDSAIKENLVVLARSPNVPENCLAVKKDIDAAVKKKLKAVLLHMHEDPEGIALLQAFGAHKFIETSELDYKPVYDYARGLQLDLTTYDNQ